VISAPAHFVRLGRAGFVFAREGVFGVVDPAMVPAPARPLLRFARLFERRSSGAAETRLSAALTRLGPSYVKLGQFLATRPDVVGAALAHDLERLQDQMPPFLQAEAEATVAASFGMPVAAVYASFGPPVAAASIAQVHRASVATATGPRPVAVKVLRPGIEKVFARDLALFAWLADLAERTQPRLRRLKPREVIATLARSIHFEMDLRLEAAAAAELRQNFADDPGFRVPRVDWQRTSKRVLTIERVVGIRIDQREAMIEAGRDVRAVLVNAASSFFNQVFRDGFFHADMHPGNLFVADDNAILAVDFGIMGRLDRRTRYFLADMLLGFLSGNYRRVAEVHFEAGYVPPDQSLEDFTQACRSIGEPLLGRPLTEISLGRLLAQLFEVTEQFHMETQPQLLLLQKTMLIAEGVGRRLDPSVNMWELAQPLIEDWMRRNRGPEARLRQSVETVAQAVAQLPRLIVGLDRVSTDLAEGGLKLHPDSLRELTDALRRQRSAAELPLWILLVVLIAALLLK
jgi:ubiquinone biosynthesis protein